MYNREIKYGLIGLLFIFSVYQFILINIGWGILLLLLAGIVLLTVFRHENIIMSLYYLRKQDMDKAQAQLDKIKAPEKLIKTQEAYYQYLNGLISMQQKGIGKSEKFFVKALQLGLRMPEDQAVAKLNLAGIYMSKRRKREAEMYLKQAKKLDTKGMLSDQIKMLKSQLGRI